MRKPGLFSFCKGEYRKSQILFIFNAVLENAAHILTTGVFLSGYLVYLGCPDFLVGLLNNSATWASVVALFSFLIFERMQRRKKLLVFLNITARFLICTIVFVPLVVENNTAALAIISTMVILGNIIKSFYNIGSTVWLMSVLSPESRNEFICSRMLFLRISFTVSSVTMGFVLDWFNKSYAGFLVVFSTSLLFSIIDIFVLANIEEPVNQVGIKTGFNLGTFLEPFKNNVYRTFLLFVFFFYVSISMSSSFTPLYLIKYLNFDYGFISTVNLIMHMFMIICTKFWGRIEYRNGLRFVLRITAVFVVGELLIYSFLTNKTYFILYLAPIIVGIGNSGFNMAIFTYRYEIMPDNNRTIYEGWYSAVQGLSSLIAPVIGSFLMRKLPVIHNLVYQYSSFQLLYLISFALAAISVILMFYAPSRLHRHQNLKA